ncbi:MAG TPA: serine/threonine protein kinase, partial [Amycolatopsis sp.]|nr:serine/threonine protein kinase [Amycolatopsis sp.]
TLVSPPLYSAGRQPAAVPSDPPPAAPAERPPWQRTGGNQQGPSQQAMAPLRSPRAPTAAFIPPERPAGQSGQSTGSNRRKGILIGSAAAAVVVVVAVLLIVLNQGDGNPGSPTESNAEGAHPSSSAPSTAPSSVSTAGLGQTPNAGSVGYSEAGNVVDQYISGAGSDAAWNLLTPAAQAIFGGQAQFQAYWAAHKIGGYSSIRADTGANADGSVDMYVTINGAGRPHWRVVNTAGGMRIDADTRIG